MRRTVFGLLCVLLSCLPALADDHGAAMAAYHDGRYSDAIKLLTPLAEAGDVEAQNTLAHIYTFGHGTEADADIALAWTRRAAEQGNAEAQSKLGQYYLAGIGVEKDPEQALHWVTLAANQFEPNAIYNLATMTLNGVGIAADPAAAIDLYYAGISLHEPNSIFALGQIYLEGKYETADIDLGLQFLAWAAQLGNRRASAMLAVVLQEVPEVPQNLIKSAIHYQIAIARGCDDLATPAAQAVARLSGQDLATYKFNLPDSIAAVERDPHNHEPVSGHCLSVENYEVVASTGH